MGSAEAMYEDRIMGKVENLSLPAQDPVGYGVSGWEPETFFFFVGSPHYKDLPSIFSSTLTLIRRGLLSNIGRVQETVP
jgi:hypothetical protein